MANISFKVVKYGSSLGYANPIIWNSVLFKHQGAISCVGENREVLLIYFLSPGSAIPQPSYNHTTKKGAIFLPIKDMSLYVDMLRNEKPIYGYMDSDAPEKNAIRTIVEPVGEGE